MKRIAILLSLVLCLITIDAAQAQLSKKEAKEWKKRRKKTSPEQFKRMYDENNTMKSDVSSLQAQTTSLQSSLAEKDAKIAELTDELRRAEGQLNAAKRAVAQAQQDAENAQKSTISMDGIVFKVQIGAFRNKDLSKYFENNENFGGEVDEEGMQRITLGIFRDYWESDTFKKYLREMGVNDAWIVPYKDGTRVAMKDVLEGVVQ
ncbi:MAG: Ezrin/radixin/moesin family protein [Cyclobacteriaceae bacterium]